MNNRKRKKIVYKCYHKQFHITVLFGPMFGCSFINYRGYRSSLVGKDRQILQEVKDKITKLEKHTFIERTESCQLN